MGKLQVCICGARNLHDSQIIGMPDPYCRVRLGDYRYKTKVVKDSLNPVWDETFRFQVADEATAQLCVELWNENIITDDLMGTYRLSLSNMTRGVVHDDWYLLNHSKTNAELHLRILACDFGSNPKPIDAWKVTEDIADDPALGAGKKPPFVAAPVTISSNVNNTPMDPNIGPAVVPAVVLAQSQPPPPAPAYPQPQPMYYPPASSPFTRSANVLSTTATAVPAAAVPAAGVPAAAVPTEGVPTAGISPTIPAPTVPAAEAVPATYSSVRRCDAFQPGLPNESKGPHLSLLKRGGGGGVIENIQQNHQKKHYTDVENAQYIYIWSMVVIHSAVALIAALV
ncbi:hypothetical protein TRSC58_00147 [Trypanosoma rangeli SC58]|uniref:C2 domain-containing protein n=1 Tax=Trypanosoma rangeli SC58 TaxID=429131 RepID=A0A061JD92_TRYRA|nr:hypothetical protein TRSC58_00147 [Trypanosoma rangeli SC58]